MIPHSPFIPDKRKKSPLPEGLPESAIEAIEKFESNMPFRLHEDTSRILALPKDLGGFGFKNLTPVQYRSMPMIAQGLDLLVRAPTGTGKTIAFLAPLIERLIYDRIDPYTKQFRIIILCPTRELVLQTAKQTKHLLGLHNRSGARDYDVATLVGSRTVVREEQQPLMESRAAILIATPGRIAQHINQTPGFVERLKSVNMVVLDEVDYLLSLGFKRDISAVMNKIGKKRQTIMFSATLSPAVRLIAKYSLRKSHEVVDLIAVPDGGHKNPEDAIRAASLIENGVELIANRAMELNDVGIRMHSLADTISDVKSITAMSSRRENMDGENYENDDENDENYENDNDENELELAGENYIDLADEEMLARYVSETPVKAKQYIVECKIADQFPVLTRIFDDIGGRFKNARDNILEHAADDPELAQNIKIRPPKILVFCPTARHAQFSAALYRQALMCSEKDSPWQAVLELHSKKHQNHRVRMATEFGSRTWTEGCVMFASDVAARGMDFEDVDLVIQIGLPASRNQYIHRLGRTARAGKSGQGLLILSPFETAVSEVLLSGLPIRVPTLEETGISFKSQKERQAEVEKEKRQAAKALEKFGKNKKTSQDIINDVDHDNESDNDQQDSDNDGSSSDMDHAATPFNPHDFLLNLNKIEAKEAGLEIGADGKPIRGSKSQESIQEDEQNDDDEESDMDIDFTSETFGDEFTQSLLEGVIARAVAPVLLKDPIMVAEKVVQDLEDIKNGANVQFVTRAEKNENEKDGEETPQSKRSAKRHRAITNRRNKVTSYIQTHGFGQPICATKEELEFQKLEKQKAISAIIRESSRSFEKSGDVYLRRCLKRVPEDHRLGLSAERAYVAFLGLHRLRSLKVRGSAEDPLALRLESVKRPQVGQTLDVDVVTLAAKEFARSMGLVGSAKATDPPTIPGRIVSRLQLENNPHIIVGTPKAYPQSEAPKAKQSKRAWPDKAARKKNVQSQQRVHYDKHAGPKRRPAYNRAGEMVHK